MEKNRIGVNICDHDWFVFFNVFFFNSRNVTSKLEACLIRYIYGYRTDIYQMFYREFMDLYTTILK